MHTFFFKWTPYALFGIWLCGFCGAATCIPLAKRLAIRLDVLSYPGGHSSHDRPVPLLGGVAMFVPIAVVYLAFLGVVWISPVRIQNPSMGQMVTLFFGTAWIVVLGTIDDKIVLGWRKKLLGEVGAVVVLLAGGHSIQTATIPFVGLVEFGWLGAPLLALVVLTITNAVNLIDGIDGLAGGICFFAAMVSGVIGWAKGDMFSATVAFAISGAVVAFLCHNFPPASIFMGDGGSLMLGFMLAVLASSSSATSAGQRSGTLVMVVAPFFPFGIALLDVMLSIIRRSISGRRLFFPDTDHLHHRLMEKIGRPRAVVIILYAFNLLLSAMTISLILGPRTHFLTLYVVLSGLVLLGLAVMVLRLYLREGLPTLLENRPHFQFLDSFMVFMAKRVRRSSCMEDLVALLTSGVRDLDFDSVQVLHQGRLIAIWMHTHPVHENQTRTQLEKKFVAVDLVVRWTVPRHDSRSYREYLNQAWDVFLRDIEFRLRELL
ncbi:UDP-GlcNAc:undecaprenyl-phosphate/decaprenyl-phosphate GlcNAc-1-phosphate transferase [Desulfovibrionales bacterium]